MTGQTIAHYKIGAKLGAGGMGEVYRARDTKLNRDVALKVLPEVFAKDAQRMARFKREAQVLASLNHANIAAIYGLEEDGGKCALALELVEGPTLAERIRQGALPLEEALPIARQIAEALEAAHERGVIHRDLKPANVKVKEDGQVKVLDFGLAKALEGDASSVDISKSPTLSVAATQAGVILGTAAYMSPEQARGQVVDKRADLWAFGVVLYEMLTGRKAFTGETISDTLAAVLRAEVAWGSLPKNTPPSIRRLLRRCLEREAKRRLRDIGDARLELDEALTASTSAWPTTAPPLQVPLWRRALPWSLAAMFAFMAALAAWQLMHPTRSIGPPITHSVIPLHERVALVPERPAVALSPDGTRLVYVALQAGSTQLYLREMARVEARPIPGTEGASGPFFSPDGESVGFFVGGSLKKVSLLGGAPITIAAPVAPVSQGATWGADDTVLFSYSPNSGLWGVSGVTARPEVITKTDPQKNEYSHRWPEILPGGRAVLFTLDTGGSFDDAHIAVLSLETGEQHVLAEGGSNAHYVPTGHLVFARRGALLAVPFDLEQLEVTSQPVTILEDVVTDPSTGAAHFALSRTGTLVYVAGRPRTPNRAVVWVDRKGAARPLVAQRRDFFHPSLSPDGKRVAVGMYDGSNSEIWLLDIPRGTLTRLTFDAGEDFAPIWTPDGKRITHSSEIGRMPGPGGGPGGAGPQLFWTPADGSGPPEPLAPSENWQVPQSWSADGQVLVYFETDAATASKEIRILPRRGESKPQVFPQTPFPKGGLRFSPDGRWLAYFSDESGRDEVYVRPFPGPGQKWQISIEGGSWPVWARNGRELFYRNGDKMMVVPVTTHPTFSAGKPHVLFEASYEHTWGNHPNYDVSPDGQRFLMIKSEQEAAPAQLNVVLNWFDELRRLVPPK